MARFTRHKWAPTVKDGEKTLELDKDYTVSYSTKDGKNDFTNVTGEITVTITGKGNYTGTVTRKYQITPKSVTIKVEDASKTYGEKDPQFTGTVEGLVNANDLGAVTYVRTNTAEAKGTYTDVLDAHYTKNANYEVTVTKGDFIINGKSVENGNGMQVNEPSNYPYDGAEHKWAPTVKDGEKTLELDKDYTVSYSTKDGKNDFTNVTGEITVTITGKGNYTGTVTRTYEITKRTVILTSADANKVYNGTPLTKHEVTGDGFAKDEGATYEFTGSQTVVGSSANAFTYTLNANTKGSNYEIKVKFGKLEVTPVTAEVTVTITGHKETVTYDGEQHGVFGYDAAVSDTLYNPDTDIKFVGGETQYAYVQGKDAGTYTMGLSAANFKNTNKNFENVTFNVTPGELVIEKREVTLESVTDNKVYDGTPLTRPDVKITGNGFVDGEVTDIHATGSVTNVSEGKVDNTITYTEGKNFNKDNYVIVLKEGTLHITPVTDEVIVIVKGNSDTVVYDGKQHSVEGYEIVKINNELYHATDCVVNENKGVSVSGTDAGTYETVLEPVNTNKNFANVSFVVKDSELKITPAPLKITTNSAEKTYDGSALTAGGKIEGVAERDKNDVKLNITGSQTEVGSSKNTYTIEWGNANAENYKIAEEDIGTLTVNKRSSGGGSSSKPTPEEEPTPTPTPTPLPTLPTTPAPTTPARRVTRSTATVTQPTSRPSEQITENETPKAESEPEVIEDEETPLAPMAGGAWALVNLILMLLTVLASLLLLLGYLGKKKYAKEDEYGNALHDANGNEIIDYTRNKKGFWRVASLIPAIAAVIAFALTENMRLPMVMTDRWTLLMVIIAVVQLIVAVLCKKKKESEEDENQANA